MTLVWAQGSVQGIMIGQTSMVARGQVSETFTLATEVGTVRCALPLGTYCRLSAHLLNKRVTVSGMVGSEANGQPRKVVAVRDIIMEHRPLYGSMLEGEHDGATQDTPKGLLVAGAAARSGS